MYVVVLFYPWFNFYFPLFLSMIMCDNELETKDKIEPQQASVGNINTSSTNNFSILLWR